MNPRTNLLNKLGTCEALAATAGSTHEHIAWMVSASEFRVSAGPLSIEESEYVESVIDGRMAEYASF